MKLFMGKRADTGEWVEGYLVMGENSYIITEQQFQDAVVGGGSSGERHMSTFCYVVDPETVNMSE